MRHPNLQELKMSRIQRSGMMLCAVPTLARPLEDCSPHWVRSQQAAPNTQCQNYQQLHANRVPLSATVPGALTAQAPQTARSSREG
mmetsp:Transcript_13345/g.47110  ORF Transcript_13345/g.47110 Transcript_13345/m.47110 type:complete len:86 (+) Transcript_13345:391-648(+)